MKVDRSAMANSLETRAPYLDRRIAEFAWRLPLDMKIRGASGKQVMKQILYKHVPEAMLDRPKQGFAIPLDRWLRGELRDWAEALLSERRLKADGLFEPGAIRSAWRDHTAGGRNNGLKLWSVLMVQSWLDSR